MTSRGINTAFGLFHAALGAVVLIESVQTLVEALGRTGGAHVHVALLAGVEAVGAALFLLGRTVRLGGGLMLATFLVAVLVHGLGRELPLLVYAAGTVFVMAHGSIWLRSGLPAA